MASGRSSISQGGPLAHFLFAASSNRGARETLRDPRATTGTREAGDGDRAIGGVSGLAEALDPVIRPIVEGLGYVLWRIDWNGARSVLQVMAENADGSMTVDDCAEISRALSPALDVEETVRGRYTLEVSSPGIDRPLVRESQFRRYAGREVRVELIALRDGRRRFTGWLGAPVDGTLVLQTEEGEVALPFEDIKSARLKPRPEDIDPDAGNPDAPERHH